MKRLEALDSQFQKKRLLLINGQYRESLSKQTFDVINPATEQLICQVSAGQKQDVDLAVNAATNALKEWSATVPSQRSLLMNNFATLIQANMKELAVIESMDNGKPLMKAKQDVFACIMLFRYYAGACERI